MRITRFLPLALSGLLLASVAQAEDKIVAAVEPAGWRPVSLLYEVHAGGLHVFSINIEAALKPEDYYLSLSLRTDGALAWVLDWSMVSAASGQASATEPAPDWFRSESLWRGEKRWVEVGYGEGGPPVVRAVPPPEEDDRPRVPEEKRRGTVDPLSAGAALVYALASQGHCDVALPIFDGRRLFEAQSWDLGPTEIPVSDFSPYSGEARNCAITVVPVTGFWRDSQYEPRPQDFTIFLGKPSDDAPPLPLRIEAETRFGALRVHLVDVSLRNEDG